MVIKRSFTVPPRAQPFGKVGGARAPPCPLVPAPLPKSLDNYNVKFSPNIYADHSENNQFPYLLLCFTLYYIYNKTKDGNGYNFYDN